MTIKKRMKPVQTPEKTVEKIIAKYADLQNRIDELKSCQDQLKATVFDISEEYQIKSFSSELGTLTVSIPMKPRETFDKKKAQTFLSFDQYQACIKYGKVPKSSVKFTKPKK